MRSVSPRDLIQAVERRGWVVLRVHGSHHIYGREGSTVRLSISVYEGRDLKVGLVRHLMKMAGISEGDL